MIIEFELEGANGFHKGMFETTGFWARFEEEYEMLPMQINHPDGGKVSVQRKQLYGYKIVSHFSFSFYHHHKEIVGRVYAALFSCVAGVTQQVQIEGIGYIQAT